MYPVATSCMALCWALWRIQKKLLTQSFPLRGLQSTSREDKTNIQEISQEQLSLASAITGEQMSLWRRCDLKRALKRWVGWESQRAGDRAAKKEVEEVVATSQGSGMKAGQVGKMILCRTWKSRWRTWIVTNQRRNIKVRVWSFAFLLHSHTTPSKKDLKFFQFKMRVIWPFQILWKWPRQRFLLYLLLKLKLVSLKHSEFHSWYLCTL